MKIYNDEIATKEKIKNAVVDIIMRKVDLPLNMRSIEKITSLSPGTIYYHYKNKSVVVFEALEDFWRSCFQLIDSYSFDEDILLALQQLYFLLDEKFKVFQKYWLEELMSLNLTDKATGRTYEAIYLDKIKLAIHDILIKRKEQISIETLNNASMDKLINFVFSNFVISMKGTKKDLDFTLYILKRILIEND